MDYKIIKLLGKGGYFLATRNNKNYVPIIHLAIR
jgi:hypothetical protein